MEIIARLGQTGGGPPGVWLMVPMSRGVLPAIDGVPVPVIGSFQWARIPDAWTRNLHRAGSAIAAA